MPRSAQEEVSVHTSPGRVWEGVALPRSVNISPSERGVGKPGFPTPPPRRGMGKPGFPISPPGGRVWEGEVLPGRMFIPSGCGASRIEGRGEHRLGARASRPRRRDVGGTPALPGRLHRARCAPRMGPDVTMGEPGSPVPPPAGGSGRAAPSSGGVGESGFPIPHPVGEWGRAQPLRRGLGKPGFPSPPPGGRVWEGFALPGRIYFHPVGVRRSRMDGCGAKVIRWARGWAPGRWP